MNTLHEGNKGFMKMIGLKRSSKHDRVEANTEKHKKVKVSSLIIQYQIIASFYHVVNMVIWLNDFFL